MGACRQPTSNTTNAVERPNHRNALIIQLFVPKVYAPATFRDAHLLGLVGVIALMQGLEILPSIRRRLLDMVDDQDIDRALARFKLQSELFLQRRKDGRPSPVNGGLWSIGIDSGTP